MTGVGKLNSDRNKLGLRPESLVGQDMDLARSPGEMKAAGRLWKEELQSVTLFAETRLQLPG